MHHFHKIILHIYYWSITSLNNKGLNYNNQKHKSDSKDVFMNIDLLNCKLHVNINYHLLNTHCIPIWIRTDLQCSMLGSLYYQANYIDCILHFFDIFLSNTCLLLNLNLLYRVLKSRYLQYNTLLSTQLLKNTVSHDISQMVQMSY